MSNAIREHFVKLLGDKSLHLEEALRVVLEAQTKTINTQARETLDKPIYL